MTNGVNPHKHSDDAADPAEGADVLLGALEAAVTDPPKSRVETTATVPGRGGGRSAPTRAEARIIRKRALAAATADAESEMAPYGLDYTQARRGIYLIGEDGRQSQLANFIPKIVREIVLDHGDGDSDRQFVIAAQEFSAEVTVRAADFAAMAWVLPAFGRRAIVMPGRRTAEHLRVAIQKYSADATRETVFAHSGWRQVEGRWAFLHAEGAVDAMGAVETIRTDLPLALRPLVLRVPSTNEERALALTTALGTLDVAPARVSAWVAGAALRAALGDARTSVHLEGRTGVRKTALAALGQAFFGSGFDSEHLPLNWASTANSAELVAHAAKDALVVVDDFAPSAGRAFDAARQSAERLFRGAANHAGRARATPDARVRPGRPPRGLFVSTGEDVPFGASLRARILIVEVEPTDVDLAVLTRLQEAASRGILAQATGDLVRALAPRFGFLGDVLTDLRERLEPLFAAPGVHPRTPRATAEIAAAWGFFLSHAQRAGAITNEDADQRWRQILQGLRLVAAAQRNWAAEASVADHFARLLVASIGAREAHFNSTAGGTPADPSTWGWDYVSGPDTWRAFGARAGWVDEDGGALLLDPEVSLAVVQRLAKAQGGDFTMTPITLRKRLREAGFLAMTDVGRGTNTVRRVLEGARRDVLAVKLDALGVGDDAKEKTTNLDEYGASQSTEKDAQTDIAASWSVFGQYFEAFWSSNSNDPTTKNAPETTRIGVQTANGRVGQLSTRTDRNETTALVNVPAHGLPTTAPESAQSPPAPPRAGVPVDEDPFVVDADASSVASVSVKEDPGSPVSVLAKRDIKWIPYLSGEVHALAAGERIAVRRDVAEKFAGRGDVVLEQAGPSEEAKK